MPRTARKPTPAQRIAQLVTLDKEIAALNKQVKDLKSEYDEIASEMIGQLDEAGTSLMRTEFGTVSILESEVASVEDWDVFHKWIRKNDAFHMLIRRVNNAPYRETLALRKNRKIPGVSTVKTRKLSLTNKKK